MQINSCVIFFEKYFVFYKAFSIFPTHVKGNKNIIFEKSQKVKTQIRTVGMVFGCSSLFFIILLLFKIL